MDRIQAMQVFLRVIETGSFVRAAETLSMPASSVTSIVKALEKHLQVRLLHRTTRSLSLTHDGETYSERCKEVLSLIETTEASLRGATAKPHGRVRVDMPGTVARALVIPNLGDFCARFPDVHLMIGINDRPVDLVQEGVDCVIRTGELRDSSLVARRVGVFRWLTCASRTYLDRHGVPDSVDGLADHCAVHYFSRSRGRGTDLRFMVDGVQIEVPMRGLVAVNETEAYIGCCLQGLGLVQLAEFLVVDHLRSGRLVEVLAACAPPPTPISLVYPQQRHMSSALRAFNDWVTEVGGLAARAEWPSL